MPKVQTIINQLSKKCPPVLPQVTQVFESDPERIQDALKERAKPQQYYVFLRILHHKTLKMLKPSEKNEYLKPLLQINPSNLHGQIAAVNSKIIQEAFLHICQGIIEAEDQFRTNTIDKYIENLTKIPLDNIQVARLEIVSAGNNFLKGDYAKAALQYLTASRMEAFLKEENTKMSLVEKSIAFAFIAPIGVESHKTICSLCLNETAKKSKHYPLLSKLYREDIITKQDVDEISKYLPDVFKVKDTDGITILEQSAFSRNMIPIINSFSTVKLSTLLRLSGVNSEEQLLILLEKTYKLGEVSIDQVNDLVRIKSKTDPSDVVKDFLTQIDTILESQ